MFPRRRNNNAVTPTTSSYKPYNYSSRECDEDSIIMCKASSTRFILIITITVLISSVLHLLSIQQNTYFADKTASLILGGGCGDDHPVTVRSSSTDSNKEDEGAVSSSPLAATTTTSPKAPPSQTLRAPSVSIYHDNNNNQTSSRQQMNDYQPNDIVYMAYYYPWYQTIDFNVRHGPLRFVPQLGLYDTSNPLIAEQHIDWMVDKASIDGLLISWDPSNSLLSQHLDTGFLQARNIHKLINGWCILYESKESLRNKDDDDDDYILPDFTKPHTFDKLIADMKLLQEKYFHLDSYWKIDGRPVVILYLTRIWKGWKRTMMTELQEVMKDSNVLFIADEPYTSGKQRETWLAKHGKIKGNHRPGAKFQGANTDMWFEAYTSYNVYEPTLIEPNDTATSYMLREGMEIYQTWSAETYMIPHVLPKYHDFREENPDLPGTTDSLMEQLKAVTCLPRTVDLAKRMPRYTFITSWNEWYEGTQIEPDVYGTSGFEWMDILKRFKESNYQCPPSEEEQQEQTIAETEVIEPPLTEGDERPMVVEQQGEQTD